MSLTARPKLTPAIAARTCAAGANGQLLLGIVVLSLASAGAAAQEPSGDWQYSATVYGWLPDIAGHTRFPAGSGGDIRVDVGTILDHLEMTFQGSFSVQKGAWGAFTDYIYLGLGAAKSRTRNLEFRGQPLPAGVTADTDFDLNSTIWTLGGSYRLIAAADRTFDLLAGARLASMKQRLDWTFSGNFGPIVPPPMSGSATTSIDLWDGIVGGRGRVAFGSARKWAVPYYFDIGGGDSELTWQAGLGLAYTFGWGELVSAWRYLDYQLKSGGPVADMNFNGPAIGATFRW